MTASHLWYTASTKLSLKELFIFVNVLRDILIWSVIFNCVLKDLPLAKKWTLELSELEGEERARENEYEHEHEPLYLQAL